MKDSKRLGTNLIFLVEVVFYLVLLGVNAFFGYEIYQKVLGTISIRKLATDPEGFVTITTMDSKLLDVFVTDQSERLTYEDGNYNSKWDDFSVPRSPF